MKGIRRVLPLYDEQRDEASSLPPLPFDLSFSKTVVDEVVLFFI